MVMISSGDLSLSSQDTQAHQSQLRLTSRVNSLHTIHVILVDRGIWFPYGPKRRFLVQTSTKCCWYARKSGLARVRTSLQVAVVSSASCEDDSPGADLCYLSLELCCQRSSARCFRCNCFILHHWILWNSKRQSASSSFFAFFLGCSGLLHSLHGPPWPMVTTAVVPSTFYILLFWRTCVELELTT